MISLITQNYSFTNIIFICFHFLIPLIIYLISYICISKNQQDWFNNLEIIKNNKYFNDNNIIFFSIFVFISTGISLLLILDYYYRHENILDNQKFKGAFENLINDYHSSISFYLFPFMILISTIGFPISFISKTFIPHILLNIVGIISNLYLMFFYMRRISYLISIFLIPLLIWQILNIVFFFEYLKCFKIFTSNCTD